MKLLLMIDGAVGAEIAAWVMECFPEDIAAIVTISNVGTYRQAKQAGFNVIQYKSDAEICYFLQGLKIQPDLGVLAWWPKILKQPLIDLPNSGFINTHPSLLPHNRGKHYNFWAIVEQAPFGVSLHMVEEGVDTGDLVAQQKIEYGWEDDGESLYKKASLEMVELFKKTYPKLRNLDFIKTPQIQEEGSFHLAKEIEDASFIDLEKEYKAKDLLNLLRARTFSGYPSCWFSGNNERYEIRVKIKKVKP